MDNSLLGITVTGNAVSADCGGIRVYAAKAFDFNYDEDEEIVITIEQVPAPAPSPRKPTPALMCEAHNDTPVDSERAWDAVKAMCRSAG